MSAGLSFALRIRRSRARAPRGCGRHAWRCRAPFPAARRGCASSARSTPPSSSPSLANNAVMACSMIAAPFSSSASISWHSLGTSVARSLLFSAITQRFSRMATSTASAASSRAGGVNVVTWYISMPRARCFKSSATRSRSSTSVCTWSRSTGVTKAANSTLIRSCLMSSALLSLVHTSSTIAATSWSGLPMSAIRRCAALAAATTRSVCDITIPKKKSRLGRMASVLILWTPG